MPYSAEHKARTRLRIVEAAARLFRRHGYQQTGVDALMGEAGLTRGGFYAHFKDKADLLVAAIDHAFDDSVENLFGRGLEDLSGSAWLRAATRRYLSTSHQQRPQSGCAVPALGPEVARSSRPIRKRFAGRQNDIVERIAERLGGDRVLATAVLASLVGALVMARVAPTKRDATGILDLVRAYWEAVADRLDGAGHSA